MKAENTLSYLHISSKQFLLQRTVVPAQRLQEHCVKMPAIYLLQEMDKYQLNFFVLLEEK